MARVMLTVVLVSSLVLGSTFIGMEFGWKVGWGVGLLLWSYLKANAANASS
jgi:hypothetical protein